ncbi:hypothetical protein SDC9_192474 [bioreactor metagenome]|uniref:Uncharacterized protein n=1 Tax=bioreactor metagenome TaxID=1076179 RepID=A0A645I0V4_9ZZZZ
MTGDAGKKPGFFQIGKQRTGQPYYKWHGQHIPDHRQKKCRYVTELIINPERNGAAQFNNGYHG